MAKTIEFKTIKSSLSKGDKACYRAIPITKEVVDLPTIVKQIADRVGMDADVMKFVAELLFAQIARLMAQGHRVEIENYLSGGLAIEGVFEAANSPWDSEKHRLIPYFTPKGDVKGEFSDVVGENVTACAKCTIKRVLDTEAKTEGVITNAPDVTVYISGVDLAVDAAAEDEGVWLEDEQGAVVAEATVTAATSTTMDCTFPTLPLASDGGYRLVVASRGGRGPKSGVAISRKSVELKSPPASRTYAA